MKLGCSPSVVPSPPLTATVTVSNIVTRRRVYDIGQFLRARNMLSATTTIRMSDITKQPMFPAASTHATLISLSASKVTMTATNYTKQAPRVSVDKISAFCNASLK